MSLWLDNILIFLKLKNLCFVQSSGTNLTVKLLMPFGITCFIDGTTYNSLESPSYSYTVAAVSQLPPQTGATKLCDEDKLHNVSAYKWAGAELRINVALCSLRNTVNADYRDYLNMRRILITSRNVLRRLKILMRSLKLRVRLKESP